MNFFRAQDQARKQTFWLITLFSISVLFLITLTNICVAWFVWYSDPGNYVYPDVLPADQSLYATFVEMMTRLGWYKALWIAGLVSGVIGIAMLFKWLSLSAGGKVVAESLGGRLVRSDTKDLHEKRLINIVEEMALASGIPVPPIYLLEHEAGINAFAAGLMPEDAVIGVTHGAIEYLNRDQLQGVIAHEFSHILNGDMRLNTKVVAVLHGILMIGEAGRTVLDFSRSRSFRSRDRNAGGVMAGIFVFGLSLIIIGALGQLCGALIKAAVSRQREFLADASAVQFTRNPDGIGGALQVIASHSHHALLKHRHAHELGHFFFANAYLQRMGLLATHPPLAIRIQRVLPAWDGQFIEAEKVVIDTSADPERSQSLQEPIPFVSALAGFTAVESEIESTTPIVDRAPIAFEPVSLTKDTSSFYQSLVAKAHDPFSVNALMAALLLSREEGIKQKQMALLAQRNPLWLSEVSEIDKRLQDTDKKDELALVELAIPTLKTHSKDQYESLKKILFDLIHADGKIDLYEWVIYQMIKQYCGRHFGFEKDLSPKYRKIEQVLLPYQIVLSTLVHQMNSDDVLKQDAIHRGCMTAGIDHLSLSHEEACSLAAFSKSVHQLARAYPLVKPRILKGLVSAATSDGELGAREKQLITGIAAVLDCPVVGWE